MGSGIGIHRSRETSCSMIAPGKIAASASGPIGFPSESSGGAGGLGMSATTLYQCLGISDSSRTIFTCDIGLRLVRLLFFGFANFRRDHLSQQLGARLLYIQQMSRARLGDFVGSVRLEVGRQTILAEGLQDPVHHCGSLFVAERRERHARNRDQVLATTGYAQKIDGAPQRRRGAGNSFAVRTMASPTIQHV